MVMLIFYKLSKKLNFPEPSMYQPRGKQPPPASFSAADR